jgi:hypothetical protein
VTADPPDDPVEPIDKPILHAPRAGIDAAPSSASRTRAFLRRPVSWLPKAPPRGADAGSATHRTGGTGLDDREYRYSVAATVLALGLVTAGYIVNRRSTELKIRSDAITLLVAGLVLVAIMLGGVIFRRGSMIGIASFMMGFELITAEDVFGVVFLIFGGWLLIRNVRRQRAEQVAHPRPAREAKRTPTKANGPPKPSKRYTPPRRSRTSARRR